MGNGLFNTMNERERLVATLEAYEMYIESHKLAVESYGKSIKRIEERIREIDEAKQTELEL